MIVEGGKKMSLPKGIVEALSKMGVESKYDTGGDKLLVLIPYYSTPGSVIRIISIVYEADPTQSCKYVGQNRGEYYEFEFKPLINIVDDA